jgi:DNA-binding response OmpR family regulator
MIIWGGRDTSVSPAGTVEAAREKLSLFQYDCILLDIGLPDGSGISLLKHIRAEYKSSNVLIISAKNALDDKIIGLEQGADDYITKPFHLAELHARIRAVYRRKNLDGASVVSFNEISLNTDTFEARVGECIAGYDAEGVRSAFVFSRQ